MFLGNFLERLPSKDPTTQKQKDASHGDGVSRSSRSEAATQYG